MRQAYKPKKAGKSNNGGRATSGDKENAAWCGARPDIIDEPIGTELLYEDSYASKRVFQDLQNTARPHQTEPLDRVLTETSHHLNTQAIARLQKDYAAAQNPNFSYGAGRNVGVLKTQSGMTGYSSFSKSRSPMKSR